MFKGKKYYSITEQELNSQLCYDVSDTHFMSYLMRLDSVHVFHIWVGLWEYLDLWSLEFPTGSYNKFL